MITLDTTLLGWRPADLDRAYLPFLRNLGIANFTSDPVFQRRSTKPPEEDPLAAGIAFATVFLNPGLSWDQLPLIRENWDGPILRKEFSPLGTQGERLEKASTASWFPTTADARSMARSPRSTPFPQLQRRSTQLSVLFDSGIRTGRDAFKALALGADAVLIGRPYVYGLALRGRAGTKQVMRMLVAELKQTLASAGYASHPQPRSRVADEGALTMSEPTRRQFIGSVGSAAAMTAPCPAGVRRRRLATGGQELRGREQQLGACKSAGRPPLLRLSVRDLSHRTPRHPPEDHHRPFSSRGPGSQGAQRPQARSTSLRTPEGAGGTRERQSVPQVADHPADVPRPRSRDLSTTVLGTQMPAPVLLAPVGRRSWPTSTVNWPVPVAADLELTYIHPAEPAIRWRT